MQRYFSTNEEKIVLSDANMHHILNVMRMHKGDKFEVVLKSMIYTVELMSTKPFSFEVRDIVKEEKELKNKVTLFYALSKGDKNEFVMQKATELGASRIVLLLSKRSVLKMTNQDFLRKKERFERIIKEASEQSKRSSIPEILGVYPLDNIPNDLLCDKNYVAYECDSGSTTKTLDTFLNINENESVSVLIGSEGGISEEEIECLKARGFETISLGKRILRTETAAGYALSVLGFILERK